MHPLSKSLIGVLLETLLMKLNIKKKLKGWRKYLCTLLYSFTSTYFRLFLASSAQTLRLSICFPKTSITTAIISNGWGKKCGPGNRVLTGGGIERDLGVVGRRLAVEILGPLWSHQGFCWPSHRPVIASLGSPSGTIRSPWRKKGSQPGQSQKWLRASDQTRPDQGSPFQKINILAS